jgi:hypothetical protein
MRIVRLIVVAALAVGAAFLAWSNLFMPKTPEPPFQVVETSGNFEVRTYPAMIAAEVEVEGERAPAIREAFRMLAGYISGDNAPSKKIEMTAPVTQQPGERIAMTAPVTQQQVAGHGVFWKVRFIMSEGSKLDTLPKPNNARVKLVDVPAQRVAAIRFSGWWSSSNLGEHREKLLKLVAEKNLKAEGTVTFAFYSPPSTLPFWRRNEVMVQLAAP